jgi:GT2 family glycosyltransferase
MRRAWRATAATRYDYYLWLNDDTQIVPSALTDAIDLAESPEAECGVVVGSTRDPSTSECTYGGFRSTGKPLFQNLRRLQPAVVPMRCTSMNGNFVLIPNEVYRRVGGMDESFRHGLGDIDYGLRLSRAGVPIVLMPGFVGECEANDMQEWADTRYPLAQRLQKLLHVKGLPPSEWLVFTRRHGGRLWLARFFSPYIRVLAPGLWDRLRWLGRRGNTVRDQ